MKNSNKVIVDPFTRTPGIAGKAFIDMHYADKIITEFTSDESSKYVYKLVGLRGSGKSVEYGKILNTFSSMDNWLVYTLSAAGDPTRTLIAKLSNEKFIDSKEHHTSISGSTDAEGNLGIVKGTASFTVSKTSLPNPNFYSEEAALDAMIAEAENKGYKILVGIDDISKTDEMVKFLSIVGKHQINGESNLYLICTGLSKNIEEFKDASNLTFFKRSDTIEIGSLNKYQIAEKYRMLLNIPQEKAVRMAKFTKGYAYAFQVLGSLEFARTDESDDDILMKFDTIMFQDSYDLIWNSLTAAEQDFVKILLDSPSGATGEIKTKMDKPQNYNTIRDRLKKKHIIKMDTRGSLAIELPRFKEFVKVWG